MLSLWTCGKLTVSKYVSARADEVKQRVAVRFLPELACCEKWI